MNDLRSAREFCFQFFFHLQLPVFDTLKKELQDDGSLKKLEDSINDYKETTNSIFSDKANIFIKEQISSCLKNYDEIENIISANLKNWKLARLSKVDHTNLLLAINDLCFSQSASKNIIINEAIEISKKFGALESSSFINGVLDSVAKKL